MPTYDFKCRKCGHVFERSQKMTDPNPPCPMLSYGKPCEHQTDKVFTKAPPAHFSGRGWAKDGYSK